MSQKRFAGTVLVLLSSFTLARGATPRAAGFSIEQVLSAPFPTELVAAPSGGRMAWVFNDEGERNIWVAGPPNYEGHALTSYRGDDGQEITGLSWTPGGDAIVFVRGGDANREGEFPNPLSDPAGIRQEVWVVSSSGGEPVKLGEGRSPAVCPRGSRVAFLEKDQIWWAPLDGSSEAQQLVRARGRARDLRWSPDGSRLAFVSHRGDHRLIGVYDWESRSLSYLDPSVDRDAAPMWSPDGTRVAFIRLPASPGELLFGPHREGEPWSIRVADVGNGRGHEVWKASAGRGSVFRTVSADSPLFWAEGDLLVFPWEKDGWTHLYSVPVSGGQAELLTPGDFEVEYATLAPNRREVIFNSNQDDSERRHLWRVAVSGGPPTAITNGAGIEWAPTPTSDGEAVGFLCSDARHPAHPAIRVGLAEDKPLAPDVLPADFPVDALVEPRGVTFSASDGLMIHGQLFLPNDLRPGEKRPAVLFFHGGSRRQMLVGWHYMGYYHGTYAFNQYLAGQGYVVLSVNYRSGIGYGMEFREALSYGATGASEFNDVLGAGLYLRSRPDVDPDRIALWGGSYGGYLTALGLARASDLFVAGVDLHGVHDWNEVIRNFVPSYDPLERQEVARRAFESSPMYFIDGWRSPVLLVHGDDDRNVPFSETVDLVEALRRRGVECEQLIFPDEVHELLLHRHWLQAFHASARFLDRHLKLGRGL